MEDAVAGCILHSYLYRLSLNFELDPGTHYTLLSTYLMVYFDKRNVLTLYLF